MNHELAYADILFCRGTLQIAAPTRMFGLGETGFVLKADMPTSVAYEHV